METYSKSDFPIMVGDDPCSELKVMQSAAGYYIGRGYFDIECGCEFPYSRESGYMGFNAATHALDSLDFEIRDCIENNHSYDNGLLPDIRKHRAALALSELQLQEEEELMQEEFHAWQQLQDEEAELEAQASEYESKLDDFIPF